MIDSDSMRLNDVAINRYIKAKLVIITVESGDLVINNMDCRVIPLPLHSLTDKRTSVVKIRRNVV